MLEGLTGWNIISSLVGLVIIGAAIGVIIALVNKNRKPRSSKRVIVPDYLTTTLPAPPPVAPTASASSSASASAAPGLPTPDPAAALDTLDDLRAKGLISEAEYAELRAKVIDRI